jgi:UDP-2,3-diacylglucosamine hydrolase
MGMKFFVSDFHFGASGKKDNLSVSQFEEFCHSLPKGGELYILGDFFDFWMEYSSVVRADFVNIYSILLNTLKRGVKIFFVRGNHDFFRGKFLQNLGIKVFDSNISFDHGGKKVFCMHGDGLTGALKHSIMKFIMRNGFFQFLYGLLHPDFAIWLAQSCSELSRKKNRNAHSFDERKKKYRRCAFNFADKNACDILIIGHSHICDLVKVDGKIYANGGVWFEKPTYVLLDEKKVFLKEFGGDLRKDIILEEKEIDI